MSLKANRNRGRRKVKYYPIIPLETTLDKLREDVTKYNLQLKKRIQDIKKSRGPFSSLQYLNLVGRSKINIQEKLINYFEEIAEKQENENKYLQKEAILMRKQHTRSMNLFMKANIAAMRTIKRNAPREFNVEIEEQALMQALDVEKLTAEACSDNVLAMDKPENSTNQEQITEDFFASFSLSSLKQILIYFYSEYEIIRRIFKLVLQVKFPGKQYVIKSCKE